jgi:hypothetical protein
MRCQDTARAFALVKADEFEKEARRIGILRSLDATRASDWLLGVAAAIREACGPDETVSEEELG